LASNEIEEIEAEIRRLKERKRFLQRIPADVYLDGTVITFTKRFSEYRGAPVYLYAAIKANGMWYTTGPKRHSPWTWEKLMQWLQGDLHTLKVVTATSTLRPNTWGTGDEYGA
jgi:hypothetical protein